MNSYHPFGNLRKRAFTLVELLIVIVIVAALASLVFVMARNGMNKAAAAISLSNLRQSGTILLSDAMEKNGRMQYFSGGGKGYEIRPYNIVRTSLGLKTGIGADSPEELCPIMHWNAAKLPPKVKSWMCTGVNFTDVPEFGVDWTLDQSIPGTNTFVLLTSTVIRPEAYPFLINSSNASGDEIFRILEKNGDYVGLRNSGKAHGCFLDGSVRELGPKELKAAGFTKAFDNSTTPPKLKTL